jgi:UDPglucose 6-dehydrogenase
MWHLGAVTAACSAAAGHTVIGIDHDDDAIAALKSGRPPVAEPGLGALITEQIRAGRLSFTTDVARLADADVLWVTYDTPVDADDRADLAFVLRRVEATYPYLRDGALVISSSQLPAGSIGELEEIWRVVANGRQVHFAASPENLRLGRAIEVFTQPDRVVVGVRDLAGRARAEQLFAPITDRIEWMSVESAEMTKHAVNAFLATSVTFINELAAICERVGADAKEVERGLKTERRIGPQAYVSPGGAFAGGTLARDVEFLRELGARVSRATPLMDGVLTSNTEHRGWTRRRLDAELGGVKGRVIAVWGLTYKPGTDTLRRSSAVELCESLVAEGAQVRAHDPAATALPSLLHAVHRSKTPLEAVSGADALVVATEWPEYRQVPVEDVVTAMNTPLIVDANRFVGATLGSDPRVRLISVGQPSRP